MQLTPPKAKTCAVCRDSFTPIKEMQKVCGWVCAVSLAESKRVKAAKVALAKERKVDKVNRQKLKTRGDWIREAQAAFNSYIRVRDAGKPCICCGRTKDSSAVGGAWDAGHYRSRGSAPHLRFDERNVHAQLKYCNRYQSGNMAGYRLGLIERIGQAALDELEADQTPRRHIIAELQAIKVEYTAKSKSFKADHA